MITVVTLAAYVSGCILCASNEDEVANAISRHAAALAEIDSYFIHVKRETRDLSTESEQLIPECERKSWRSKNRFRQWSRNFVMLGPAEDGSGDVLHAMPGHGYVDDYSVDDKQIRLLRGWDPDHPFQLPLEFGRSAGEYARARGRLAVRDPAEKVVAYVAGDLLWDIFHGWSLREASEVSEFTLLASGEDATVRLRLESSTHSALQPLAGLLVDLDPEHGWQICRLERAAPKLISRVVEFAPIPSGGWLAKEIETTLEGKVFDRRHVVEFRVNEEIRDEDLTVAFPEGCFVSEGHGPFHLWGKDGPAKTFDTERALYEYITERAREIQGGGKTQPIERVSGNRWPTVIVLNVVLIALLLGLTALRRWVK
jgi:hypothetical protein